ncbi:hypothetical protein [Streptomyces sp. NBC_01320]|uniref:hypothetical protein n=1 Tax=Streptomyces sp. NBC_01320 TaxID=2903824 RepID=UPI002E0DB300|nr:hypothetical protein OG395_57305 [Streptomyces sp. NBC_01320]
MALFGVDVAAAALEITAIVAVHHGGRFRHRHLLAEARRYLTRTLHGHPAPPHADTTITAAAIRDHCIPGDPPNPTSQCRSRTAPSSLSGHPSRAEV